MSLGAFLQDDNYGGSWADEVEDSFGKPRLSMQFTSVCSHLLLGSQPLPAATRSGGAGYSSYGGGFREERSEFLPLLGSSI